MTNNKYWLGEDPEVLRTEKNVLRYYKKAGKLQVSLPDWQDNEGETKPGKTVTLDIESMQLSDDKEDIRQLFQEMMSLLLN